MADRGSIADRSMTRLLALALAAGVCLAGCGVLPSAVDVIPDAVEPDSATAGLLEAGSFSAPRAAIDTRGLFELDAPMRDFVQGPLARAIRQAGGREQGLVDALYQREALQLRYDPDSTGSAADTFAARRGNCLSLVIMTAAFAKHLGLRVDYRAAVLEQPWSRRGGLYLASGHVNITIGRRMDDRAREAFGSSPRLTVDFLPPEELLGLRTRAITEDELVALYLMNRAAEALAAGALDDAHGWAVAAVRAGPERAAAWNTLGAVFRRHGDTGLAIRAFRAALARAPGHLPAMANLARALAAAGQDGEAGRWAQRLAAIEAYPPFHDLAQGWQAVAQRDWLAARKAFARELRRSGPAADVHHGLAIAAQGLGDLAEARRQLLAAGQTSGEPIERQRFLAKLAALPPAMPTR